MILIKVIIKTFDLNIDLLKYQDYKIDKTLLNTKMYYSCVIPYEYKVKDVSKRVIRVFQNYTSLINKVILE